MVARQDSLRVAYRRVEALLIAPREKESASPPEFERVSMVHAVGKRSRRVFESLAPKSR